MLVVDNFVSVFPEDPEHDVTVRTTDNTPAARIADFRIRSILPDIPNLTIQLKHRLRRASHDEEEASARGLLPTRHYTWLECGNQTTAASSLYHSHR